MRKFNLSIFLLTVLASLIQEGKAQGFEFTLAPSDFRYSALTEGALATGDVDGDGDIDVFISSNRPIPMTGLLYLNDGSGGFMVDSINSFIGTELGSAEFVDVDEDGDLDLFQTGRAASGSGYFSLLYLNDGIGNFTMAPGVMGVAEGGFSFGDIDNDGDQDLLLAGIGNSGEWTTHLYQNQSDGTFLGVSLPSEVDSLLRVYDVEFSDLDGDNDLDCLLMGITTDGEGVVQTYLNDGLGVFSLHQEDGIKGARSGGLVLGDSDNDGDVDLIVFGVSAPGYITTLYENNGNGDFSLKDDSTFAGFAIGDCEFVDFDGDNDNDLFLTGWNNNLITRVYENLGSNNFALANEDLNGTDYSKVAIQDFNGDGRLDIIMMGSPETYMYFGADDMVTGTYDKSLSKFKIFPNPTNSFIHFDFSGYSDPNNCTIKIINSTSQEVFSTSVNQQFEEVDVSTIGKSGMYFIQILNDSGELVEVKKLLIE